MGSRRRLSLLAATAALTLSLVGGASAQGAAQTVTLGSSLGPSLSPGSYGAVATLVQTALPGATLTAPFNGTITSWKIVGASGGPLHLRVVRPTGGGAFTGAGRATAGPLTGTGVLTFSANLPIRAGDMIGLDSTSPSDTIGVGPESPTIALGAWIPPFVDNAPGRTQTAPADPRELGLQATVVSNCVVPKVKGKKKKAAKKALRNAGCVPGKVKKKKGAGKGARVKKQNPKAGTEVPAGTSVNLKLR